jgi:hypothetical protein
MGHLRGQKAIRQWLHLRGHNSEKTASNQSISQALSLSILLVENLSDSGKFFSFFIRRFAKKEVWVYNTKLELNKKSTLWNSGEAAPPSAVSTLLNNFALQNYCEAVFNRVNGVKHTMKKILFAAVLAGCFFIAKITFAGETGSLMPFQDIWDAINDLKNQVAGIQSEQSISGADGKKGLSCWDLNGNGKEDPDEDKNQDGNFDALDCQCPPGDSASIQPGVTRYVYSAVIPNNIYSADFVSQYSGEETEGKSYFMKVDTPQISISDMPMISLYGKEDPHNVRMGGDAWESENTYTYIRDGSIYILFAEKKDGQDPVFYLPRGAYKLVVVY